MLGGFEPPLDLPPAPARLSNAAAFKASLQVYNLPC